MKWVDIIIIHTHSLRNLKTSKYITIQSKNAIVLKLGLFEKAKSVQYEVSKISILKFPKLVKL